MNLATVLKDQEEQIIHEAALRIGRSPVSHYWTISEREKAARLMSLFRTVTTCIEKRELSGMLTYCRNLADERFKDKYKLHELHSVFNALEEIIWQRLTECLKPSQYADALGLVSSIFCLGKEILAKEYITLTAEAASSSEPVMNLS